MHQSSIFIRRNIPMERSIISGGTAHHRSGGLSTRAPNSIRDRIKEESDETEKEGSDTPTVKARGNQRHNAGGTLSPEELAEATARFTKNIQQRFSDAVDERLARIAKLRKELDSQGIRRYNSAEYDMTHSLSMGLGYSTAQRGKNVFGLDAFNGGPWVPECNTSSNAAGCSGGREVSRGGTQTLPQLGGASQLAPPDYEDDLKVIMERLVSSKKRKRIKVPALFPVRDASASGNQPAQNMHRQGASNTGFAPLGRQSSSSAIPTHNTLLQTREIIDLCSSDDEGTPHAPRGITSHPPNKGPERDPSIGKGTRPYLRSTTCWKGSFNGYALHRGQASHPEFTAVQGTAERHGCRPSEADPPSGPHLKQYRAPLTALEPPELPTHQCSTCGEEFNSAGRLAHHITSPLHDSGLALKCATCGVRPRDRWALAHHVLTHEPSAAVHARVKANAGSLKKNNFPFRCFCHSRFQTKADLCWHKRNGCKGKPNLG